MPKITVITPSYNQSQFLEECICSVIDQNYHKLEYIIIDGGSSDGSVEIIQKYQEHLTYWISEPDHGQSDALNKGFQQASGEIVAWLNSDDFYLPGALEHVAQIYRAKPTAPFYFGNGLRVAENGDTKRVYFSKNSHRFNRDALRFGLNYILQPATFMNRQSLSKIGGVSLSLTYGMDTDLWLRLSTMGDPVPIPAQLAASREYGTTKSSAGSFARVEELRQIAETHTGLPLTPGIICYFLDTLYRQAQEDNTLYSTPYQREILRFWGKTSLMMDQFGAAPDGFPLPPAEQKAWFHRLKRASKVYLRNLIKGYTFLRKRYER